MHANCSLLLEFSPFVAAATSLLQIFSHSWTTRGLRNEQTVICKTKGGKTCSAAALFGELSIGFFFGTTSRTPKAEASDQHCLSSLPAEQEKNFFSPSNLATLIDISNHRHLSGRCGELTGKVETANNSISDFHRHKWQMARRPPAAVWRPRREAAPLLLIDLSNN